MHSPEWTLVSGLLRWPAPGGSNELTQSSGMDSQRIPHRMEARRVHVLFALLLAPALMGATYQSKGRNFTVTAPTPEIARQVGDAAEIYRKQLAIEWLGYELPRWSAPCPIKVKVGQIGAGGATTFSFFPNAQGTAEVCNWDMNIQGSLERILDSVLPHEVSHTIFACHFRRPLPRWADEGAATLAEHESERRRQELTVTQVIKTPKRIPLKNLLNIKDYPRDMQDVLTLYAEGYSLADLLVREGGRARYLKFLGDAHQRGWDQAIRTHYGYRGVEELEKRWQDWVIAGSPEIELPKGQLLAEASSPKRTAEQGKLIVRGQKPEDPFLDDATNETAEPVTAPGKAPLAAPEVRALKNNQKTALPPAVPRQGKADGPASAEDEWKVDEDRVQPPRQPNATSDSDRSTAPRKNRKDVPVAESRSSATHRQVTEWSEFPQDPRPSPFALPGRNRSGARP